jgi:hypothetical protein
MSIDNRRAPRFRDFARARLDELCHMSGYLEDISLHGCRVRFPHSFEIDTDQEYTLSILPTFRSGLREFSLRVQPQWTEASADSIEIGFCVLPSPGIQLYGRYVELLSRLEVEQLQEA